MNDGSNVGDNSRIEVDQKELQDALDELLDKKHAVDEKTGQLRNAIKQIVEGKGWHKSALADIRRIDAMSETARADYLRTFDPMMEVMYLGKWKDEMHGLDLGESSDADREA